MTTKRAVLSIDYDTDGDPTGGAAIGEQLEWWASTFALALQHIGAKVALDLDESTEFTSRERLAIGHFLDWAVEIGLSLPDGYSITTLVREYTAMMRPVDVQPIIVTTDPATEIERGRSK